MPGVVAAYVRDQERIQEVIDVLSPTPATNVSALAYTYYRAHLRAVKPILEELSWPCPENKSTTT